MPHPVRFASVGLVLALGLAPAAWAGEPAKDEDTTQLKTYSVGGTKATPKLESAVTPIEKPKLDIGLDMEKPGPVKMDMTPFVVMPVTAQPSAPARPATKAPPKPAVAPAKPAASGANASGGGSTPSVPTPTQPARNAPPQGGAVPQTTAAAPPPGALTLVPLSTPAPEYPRDAAIAGTQGYVVVEFTINAEGSTQDIAVAESSPPRVFDQAARRAVSRWKFQPLVEDGAPVERRVQRRIDFTL